MSQINVLLVGVAIGICATLLSMEIWNMHKRLQKLEQANKLRLPHEAYEAILDGMAALDVRDREMALEKMILENAKEHFSKALKTGTKRAK